MDLVVPQGPLAAAWSLLVLGGCVAGVVAGRHRPALAPWLAFLASKVATTVLFFGYARQGALVTPVVALLLALAAARWVRPLAARWTGGRLPLVIALVLALPVAVEAVRWLREPQVTIDGQAAGPVDPFPPDEHRDQAIVVR